MKNHLSDLTQDFLRKLDSARRSRAAVGILLALSRLATASAQTITPLYGLTGAPRVEPCGYATLPVPCWTSKCGTSIPRNNTPNKLAG